MCARWKRWMTAVAAIAAADAAILLVAGAVVAASQQMHASVTALVGTMLGDVGALFPPTFLEALGAILGVLGAGWWQQHLLGPAFGGEVGAGAPALGGVLAAPVYALVRRNRGREPAAEVSRPGSPPHRVFVAAVQALPPVAADSTPVQGPP